MATVRSGGISATKIPLYCYLNGVVMHACVVLMALGNYVLFAAVVLVVNGVFLSHLLMANKKAWAFMGSVIQFTQEQNRVDNLGLLEEINKWKEKKYGN